MQNYAQSQIEKKPAGNSSHKLNFENLKLTYETAAFVQEKNPKMCTRNKIQKSKINQCLIYETVPLVHVKFPTSITTGLIYKCINAK